MLIVILRAVVSPAKALIPAIRPLLSAALQSILHTVSRVFPHAEQGLKRKREQGAVLLSVLLIFCFAFIYSGPHLLFSWSCILSFDLTNEFPLCP